MKIEWSIIDRFIKGAYETSCIPSSTWKEAQEFFKTRDLSVFSEKSLELLGAMWENSGYDDYEYITGTKIPNIFYSCAGIDISDVKDEEDEEK